MQDRCFIDTNIWLYALIQAAEEPAKHQQAAAFLANIQEEIVVSTQVVNEISSNLLRKAKKDNAYLHSFLLDFSASYTVVAQQRDDLLTASTLRKDYCFSFWDSLIAASALNAGCEILYSEDMQDGLSIYNRVNIKNPLHSH